MIERLKALSKGQMLAVTIITYAIYFLLTILAPVLTICIKFDLFSVAETKLKISGWAIILLLVAAVVGLTILNKSITKMTDTRPANAYFKYTLQTISNLILPVATIFIVIWIRADMAKASSTLILMCSYYIAGGIIDGAIISFIDRENRLRDGSLEDKEKDDRRNLV